ECLRELPFGERAGIVLNFESGLDKVGLCNATDILKQKRLHEPSGSRYDGTRSARDGINQNLRRGDATRFLVVGQFGKEASQARDYCVAKNATLRAARPDPSRRKERLLRMTIKLTH